MAANPTANKTKHSMPGSTLALTLAIDTADVPANTVMAVSGDLSADRAAAGSTMVLGRLVKPASVAGGNGTVETPFRTTMDVTLSDTVVAGDRLKIGVDGGDGESLQRFAKWIAGTDNPVLIAGMALQGGIANDEVRAGFF